MKISSKTVVCPFHRVFRRHFTVPFCDNLISGVPHCILWDFYPDYDPFTDFDDVRDYDKYMDSVVICSHFVRSDVYHPSVKKPGCYFGGLCVHPESLGFSACTVDCFKPK